MQISQAGLRHTRMEYTLRFTDVYSHIEHQWPVHCMDDIHKLLKRIHQGATGFGCYQLKADEPVCWFATENIRYCMHPTMPKWMKDYIYPLTKRQPGGAGRRRRSPNSRERRPARSLSVPCTSRVRWRKQPTEPRLDHEFRGRPDAEACPWQPAW